MKGLDARGLATACGPTGGACHAGCPSLLRGGMSYRVLLPGRWLYDPCVRLSVPCEVCFFFSARRISSPIARIAAHSVGSVLIISLNVLTPVSIGCPLTVVIFATGGIAGGHLADSFLEWHLLL